MENEKLGQEPAPTCEGYHVGMSKRFYAACMAMQGILANSHMSTGLSNKDGLIRASYEIADELLKQENR